MSRAPPRSNVALLTEGQAYIRRAKQARRDQVEAIKFDDDARREWLTGFSKRKKQKTEERRTRAKQRDKEAHLEDRRKARRELRERAAENVRSVRLALGLDGEGDPPGEADDAASRLPEAGPSNSHLEYEDDDQIALVTIEEDFDPSVTFSALPVSSDQTPSTSDRQPLLATRATAPGGDEAAKDKGEAERKDFVPVSGRRAQSKLAKERDKVKTRKRVDKEKTRSMETKAERKKGREMEAKKRVKKARIAMDRDGRKRGRR